MPACRQILEHHEFDPQPSLAQLVELDGWAGSGGGALGLCILGASLLVWWQENLVYVVEAAIGLAGAAAMDCLTREPVVNANPAALLALMWYHLGSGRGAKDMVLLPYKDRLELFSRYLQQLVMESLGKSHDGGQGGSPGNRRLRQQGIDRSTCLCSTAS